MGNDDPGFAFHGGETPGFSSSLAYDSTTGVGIVVLSNEAGTDGGLGAHLMRSAIPVETTAMQQARKVRAEIALDPKWAGAYSGKYQIKDGPAKGMMITIEYSGTKLLLKDDATPPEGLQLHAQDEQTFFTVAPDLDVTFGKEPDGSVGSLTIKFAGTESTAARIK